MTRRTGSRTVNTYVGVHAHLRDNRGPASAHKCVTCGERARDWSYLGGDPGERRDPVTGCLFSLDYDRYVPRCRPCHRAMDGVGSKRLTAAQVADIRARHVPGRQAGHGVRSGNTAALAAEFGITKQYVGQLTNGKWRVRNG